MNEVVWMIEKSIDGVAHWWVRGKDQYGYWDDPSRWTTDQNKARHYRNKVEAEYVIGREYELHMVGCVATEHMFISEMEKPNDQI